MDDQLGLCFDQPLSAKEGEWITWGEYTPPPESTSDGEFSSFLDFILSEELLPSSPLPPEMDPFFVNQNRLVDAQAEEAFSLDVLVGDKGSPCSSGLSVNLGKSKLGTQTEVPRPLPVRSFSVSASEGDDAAARHDGLSRGSRAVDSCGPTEGTPIYSRSNPSDQEEDLSKRQIRLMKNRQSALQSRQRKKSYVKDLEAKCRMLEGHCNQLKQAMTFKDLEICVLREELARSKRLKGQDGASVCMAEPAVLVKDSLPLEFLSRRARISVGHYLAWTVQLLFLLLLVLLMQEAPKRNQSGVDLKMDHTRGTCHPPIGSSKTRALLSPRGRKQEYAIIWRQKCYSYLRRRKKLDLFSVFIKICQHTPVCRSLLEIPCNYSWLVV